MPSAVARLEVVTEVFDPPPSARKFRTIASVDDPALRAIVAEPDWIDEELDFGPNKIGPGRAFAWSAREAAQSRPEEFAVVAKRWVDTEDGRHLLIESVEYISLYDELVALPGPKARLDDLRRRALGWAGVAPAQLRDAYLRRLAASTPAAPHPAVAANRPIYVPTRRLAQVGTTTSRPILLASASPRAEIPGLVIDWTSITSGTANFTLRGDETFHLTGTSYFTGTTVIEAGAVLKFRNRSRVSHDGWGEGARRRGGAVEPDPVDRRAISVSG